MGVLHYETLSEEEIKEMLREEIDTIFKPVSIKYSKRSTYSPVNPCYIEPYIHGGMMLPKYTNTIPKFSKSSDVWEYEEYGFDKEGRCRYCAQLPCDSEYFKIREYYLYKDDVIYRIWVEGYGYEYGYRNTLKRSLDFNNYKNIDDYSYKVEDEYHFKDGRVHKIVRCDITQTYIAKYRWLNEDIAIVTYPSEYYTNCGSLCRFEKEWAFVKEKEEVIGVFSIRYRPGSEIYEEETLCKRILSHNNQTLSYVYLDDYTVTMPRKIEHSKYEICYSIVNDEYGKPTEFYELEMLGEKYIVRISYLKPPKGFSYKKGKEVYKSEIMRVVEETISRLDFKPKLIGIQYASDGYSIMDIDIGFDKGNNDDIQNMTECIQVNFSHTSIETVMALDTYIATKEYYKAYKRLILAIKKEIEEKYQIKVILDEID